MCARVSICWRYMRVCKWNGMEMVYANTLSLFSVFLFSCLFLSLLFFFRPLFSCSVSTHLPPSNLEMKNEDHTLTSLTLTVPALACAAGGIANVVELPLGLHHLLFRSFSSAAASETQLCGVSRVFLFGLGG